jgi:heme/copper-type cytochrome/quinol oxidase subunit 4
MVLASIMFVALCYHSNQVYHGAQMPLFEMEMTKEAPESWALLQVFYGLVALLVTFAGCIFWLRREKY